MKKLESIKNIIDRVAKRTGLESKLSEAKIFEIWQKEVGVDVSNHTTPVKLFKGKLFVRVDESIWMSQLTFIKKDIIDKLNKSINANLVKDIFFTINR